MTMTGTYRAAIDHAVAELRQGRLAAQRWPDGQLVFYPRGIRLGHGNETPDWETVSTGTVVASTTVHEHSHPEYQAETPFTLLIVDAEGARIMCRLAPDRAVPAVGDAVSLSVVSGARGAVIVAS